jgi:hypothetical protein
VLASILSTAKKIKIKNIELLFDPTVLLLGIYPKELKTCAHKKLDTEISCSFYWG